MAKLIARKISQENPLLRALKLGQLTLRGQQFEVKGIIHPIPQGLLVKLKNSSERPFRVSKAEVIEALRILDEGLAKKAAQAAALDSQKETVQRQLFRSASMVNRYLPPSRIAAAPASARSAAARYRS